MSEDTNPYRSAAAAAPVGPVPMADPDAYLAAAAERQQKQWRTVSVRCECGATPNHSADWRWAGLNWEHFCRPQP